MNPRLFQLTLWAFAWGSCAVAQVPAPQNAPAVPNAPMPVYPNNPASAIDPQAPRLTPEQLDRLLGPIALYPDALIALILPSATEPSDIVLAERYLARGEGPAQIDDQPWADSVKALAHYPTVMKWMDENLAWTKQLGEAFLQQPAEVMNAIQHLRAEARAAGTLVDTPQQQIVAEAGTVSIVPAQPDVIYVPYYDPEIVYLPRRDYAYGYYPDSFFTFSMGYPVGFWLGYNLDWGHRRLLIVDRRERERYWRDQRDWRRPAFDSHFARTSTPVIRPWSPNPAYVRSSAHPQFRRSAPEIVRPAPIARETHRSLIADWNAPGAQDRAQRNRETPRRTSNGQGSMTPPPTNSFHSAIAPPPVPSFTPLPPMTPMAPAPLATPMPQPAQTPPTVYSRGNRVPSSDGQDSSRAPRNRSGPPRDRANVPAATRSAPAPSPQAAPAPPVAPVPATPPAPNTERTQPISRGGRPERTTPVASAPQAESSPSDVQGDARRGRSRGDRRD